MKWVSEKEKERNSKESSLNDIDKEVWGKLPNSIIGQISMILISNGKEMAPRNQVSWIVKERVPSTHKWYFNDVGKEW